MQKQFYRIIPELNRHNLLVKQYLYPGIEDKILYRFQFDFPLLVDIYDC